MKIPTTNLDEYRTAHKEFEKLRRKDFNGGGLGCLLFIISHLAIGLIFILIARIFPSIEGVAVCGAIFLFPPFWIYTFLFIEEMSISNKYQQIYNRYSHKSKKYLRLKEIEDYLPTLKSEIEKQIFNYLDNDLPDLIKQLRLNSQNKPVYEYVLNVFRENDSLIRESAKLIKDSYALNKYKDILKKNDIWFEDELKNEVTKKQNIQNLPTPSAKETKTFSSSSYNLLGLNEPIQRPRHIQPTEKDKQTERISKIETSRIHESPNQQNPTQSQNNAPKQQTFNFNENEGELERTDILPEKRKRLTRPRTIKASQSFWENLGKRRIEIGKRGELLVLNDEKKRIIREEGKEFLQYLEHSSVVQGDGLGYDITSILEGEKIFIEVKTTTGKFDADLIFTEKEKKVMRELGDKYFLYRVYEFNTKTNEGKLHIFKGCEEVESFFDFTPQTYSLRRKS